MRITTAVALAPALPRLVAALRLRAAVAFTIILLAASPAVSQMEPGRELELGGGWMQFKPAGHRGHRHRPPVRPERRLGVDDVAERAHGHSHRRLGRDASRWRNQCWRSWKTRCMTSWSYNALSGDR